MNLSIVKDELKNRKVQILILFILIFIFVGLGIYLYLFEKTDTSKGKIQTRTETGTISWQDQILYTTTTATEPSDTLLHSINTNGSEEKQHSFKCDGESINEINNVARSANGKTLALVLTMKKSPPSIYLYSLVDDTCTPTQISVDNLYSQNVSFSPNGKYLAYVFYGLVVYDLEAKKSYKLTAQPGSASNSEIIVGPVVWNQTSSAIYMPVAADLTQEHTQVNVVKVHIPDGTSGTVVKLADYYKKDLNKIPTDEEYLQPTPDNPTVFAISPDEKKIVYELNGNLVMQSLTDPSSIPIIIYNQLEHTSGINSPLGRITNVVWLPTGWIVYNYNQLAPGSSAGGIEASFNGEKAIKLSGYIFSVNLSGDKIAYNFEYFGNYYVAPSGPFPTDFRRGIDDTGHQYDGIGIYNLETKQDTKLSGKDKPSGVVWTWFW